MEPLESYEWCNIWFERADDRTKKRVLLIGDSITNAYRPIVNQLLGDQIYVDMLATSKAIDNSCLKYEIDYMLKISQFDYEIIHFNNGLHGWHISSEEYEHNLENVILYIKSITKVKIIIALSTPITKAGETSKINDDLNNKVIQRNQAVLRLALKYNLIVNDIYSLVLGKSEYRIPDGYHYNDIGQKTQAEAVMKLILENLM